MPQDVAVFELLAATIAQEITKTAVDGAGGWADRRATTRSGRMDAYLSLQRSVMRSQMRVDTLFTIHSAQFNVAHIAAWVTGYPLLVGILNQLTDDLSQVTGDWRRLRLVAAPDVASAADGLVLALCAVLTSVDPGWMKPRARAAHKKELQRAKDGLATASNVFDSAAKADAAPRRRDRRAASRALTAQSPTP